MRAAIFDKGEFSVGNVPDPSPRAGQVLVRPLVCGVCGSDLHARHHRHELAFAMAIAGFRGFMNPDLPVVMGHEFVCEILDHGAECTRQLERGRRVVALPFVVGANGVELLGFSNTSSGAMAEAMLLQEAMLFPVPDHVPTDVAALTEPLAVAVHAVAAAKPDADCAFAVHGCGPVGLFIIARLRHLGFGPILAVDPDPARRAQAARLGADEVMAPDNDAICSWWSRRGIPMGLSDAAALGGVTRCRPVVFECVGKPGMLRAVAQVSPMKATIVVVGVCMQDDGISPTYLLMKEMTMRFVFAYDPPDFTAALDMITQAPDPLASLVTGHGGLDEVSQVFDRLAGGGGQVKVLIHPQRSSAA